MHWSAVLPLAAGLVANANGQTVDGPMGETYTSPEVLPAKPAEGAGEWQAAYQQARGFVGQLSLEEKVNLTTGQGTESLCVGNTGAVTRLNFPGLCLHDSPAGVRLADLVSVFPSGINAAATWDRDLIRQRGEQMGAEARGKGINVLLAPAMNMARVAAGGRNWEASGGDPYLAGEASVEMVKGIQSQGVIANAKHFVANEQEHGRNEYSSNVDDRTMHEVYQWPFAASVHAGVGSVMCSYNRVNQTHSCENSKVVNGLTKEELNFQGFITTDWVALYDEGISGALAGTDMNMPGIISYADETSLQNPAVEPNSLWGAALVEMVNNGTVPIERVDDMVTRTMTAYYKLGQDQGYPAVNFNWLGPELPGNEHVDVRADHANLIREMGAASAVLLKNDGILPLQPENLGSVGVFGRDAGPPQNGLNSCEDHACSEGTLAIGWGSGTANFTYLVDPLAGLTSYLEPYGTQIDSVLDDFDYARIGQVGSQSNTCFAFALSDSGEQYLTVDGNIGDRNNLTLWHGGDALIETVANTCANTIVVIHSTGQVDMEAWVEHPNVKAIVWAGLPGQESGNGLVDVLFGNVNPSARLPYTIARQRDDYSADVIYQQNDVQPYAQIDYREGLLIDYRHFDQYNIEPRYEFGYGLSYSTFNYSGIDIQRLPGFGLGKRWNNGEDGIGGPGALWSQAKEVSFSVMNADGPAGFEVSQMYLSFPDNSGEPPKVLRGFERTWIEAGATERVTLQMTNKDLSVWDVTSQSWMQPSGKFTVWVGSSSRNLPLSVSFYL